MNFFFNFIPVRLILGQRHWLKCFAPFFSQILKVTPSVLVDEENQLNLPSVSNVMRLQILILAILTW